MKKKPAIPNLASGFVRRPLEDLVADHLRRVIGRDTVDYLPSERDLAAGLGVSRPVVRDALAKLEAERLIERRHGRITRILREKPPECAYATVGMLVRHATKRSVSTALHS